MKLGTQEAQRWSIPALQPSVWIWGLRVSWIYIVKTSTVDVVWSSGERKMLLWGLGLRLSSGVYDHTSFSVQLFSQCSWNMNIAMLIHANLWKHHHRSRFMPTLKSKQQTKHWSCQEAGKPQRKLRLVLLVCGSSYLSEWTPLAQNSYDFSFCSHHSRSATQHALHTLVAVSKVIFTQWLKWAVINLVCFGLINCV